MMINVRDGVSASIRTCFARDEDDHQTQNAANSSNCFKKSLDGLKQKQTLSLRMF